jgi:hypothetical protein
LQPSNAVTATDRRGLEGPVTPDSGLHFDLGWRPAEDVEAVRLAQSVRPGAAVSRCSSEDERAALVGGKRLERVSLGSRPLVDVAAEDDLGSGGGE